MEKIPKFKKEHIHYDKKTLLKINFWIKNWLIFWKPLNIIRQIFIVVGFFTNLFLIMYIIADTTGDSILSYIILLYTLVGLLISPSILNNWGLLDFLTNEYRIKKEFPNITDSDLLNYRIHEEIKVNNLGCISSIFYLAFHLTNSILSTIIISFLYPLFFSYYNNKYIK